MSDLERRLLEIENAARMVVREAKKIGYPEMPSSSHRVPDAAINELKRALGDTE